MIFVLTLGHHAKVTDDFGEGAIQLDHMLVVPTAQYAEEAAVPAELEAITE